MQNFYENLIFNLKFIKNSQVASPISHITPFPSWFSTFPTHSTISLSTNTSYKSLFAPLPRNFSFLFLFLSHLRVFVEVMQTNLKFPYVKIILGIEFSLLPFFFVFFCDVDEEKVFSFQSRLFVAVINLKRNGSCGWN